jgi:outer membrane immunogenic protein
MRWHAIPCNDRDTLAGIAFVALAAPAAAADMPVKAPAPVLVDIWTGGYVGANVGYDWGSDRINSAGSPGACQTIGFGGCDLPPVNAVSQASAQAMSFNTTLNHSGLIYGGQAGHNWLVRNSFWTSDAVLGVEVDFQGKSDNHHNTFSSSTPVPGCPALCSAAFVVAQQATLGEKIDTLGTLRGRAGVLWGPNTLIYLTAGLAFAHATSSAYFTQTGVPLFGSVIQPWTGGAAVSQVLFGPTVGAGVEWKWTANWSVKAEYLYADLGSTSFTTGSLQSTSTAGLVYSSATANVQTHIHDNIARVGINYKFW